MKVQNGPIAIKKYFCKGCKDFEKTTFFLPNGRPLPGDLFYCKNKEYIKRRNRTEHIYLSDNPEHETPEDCPYKEIINNRTKKEIGCICQDCKKLYKIDLNIPNNLWEKIKPEGKSKYGGLLCGSCIMNRLEKLQKGTNVYFLTENENDLC